MSFVSRCEKSGIFGMVHEFIEETLSDNSNYFISQKIWREYQDEIIVQSHNQIKI